MKLKIFLHFLLLCLVLAGLSACNGVSTQSSIGVVEKNGVRYGVVEGLFNHRWWNYYERALSYADGGFWQEAENDLREAIRQRSNDQRRARTYGMHFLDYFPHRELGVVLFQTGRFEEAAKELELSISQEKSAKAELYLDRARKAILQASSPNSTPPVLKATLPAPGSVVTEPFLELTGSASAINHLDKIIAINRTSGIKKQVTINKIGVKTDFDIFLPISSGNNAIMLKAVDLLGNASTVETNVILKSDVDTVKRPAEEDISARLRVAVNTFKRKLITVTVPSSSNYEDGLVSAMKGKRRFNAIDRRKLAEALERLKIEQSGLEVDDKSAMNKLALPEYVAADTVLLGNVLERKGSVEIYARLVDTETAEILTAVDVYGEDDGSKLDNLMAELGSQMQERLSEEMPLCEGKVLTVSGDSVGVAFQGCNIKKGMKCVFYDQHSAEAKEAGTAHISSEGRKMCYATLCKGSCQINAIAKTK